MGIFCWPIRNEVGPATFLNLIFCWAQHQCVAPNQCFSYLKTSHPYCLWSDTHVLWFETKTFLSNTNKCQVFILLCTRTRYSFDPIPSALCLLLQQFSFAMDLFAVCSVKWHIQVVNHRTIHTFSLPFHIASCTYIQIAGPKSIYTAPPSSLITIVIITQIILIAQMQRAVQYGAPYLI